MIVKNQKKLCKKKIIMSCNHKLLNESGAAGKFEKCFL